jgi:hypothetical protein
MTRGGVAEQREATDCPCSDVERHERLDGMLFEGRAAPTGTRCKVVGELQGYLSPREA